MTEPMSEAERLRFERDDFRAQLRTEMAITKALREDKDELRMRAHHAEVRADAAERKLAESLDALAVATELIDRLAFDDECDYDHHDYCQAHNLHERPCPHPLGRQFVAAWRAVEAEQKEAADDAHQ